MGTDLLWENIFSSRPWGKYPSEELIRFVAGNFYKRQPRHQVRIMEVGFGIGANLWFAAREGFCVFGIEGAPSGLAIAQSRLDAEVPGWRTHGASLVCGDMCERLPYESNSMDAVIDSAAVMCVLFEQAKAVYAELYRCAKPGGKLFVRTSNAGAWGDGTGKSCGLNAWQPIEGPTVGTGCVRFTSRADWSGLLGDWRIDSLELHSRTLENGKRTYSEWIVIANK
ncbi:MAG: class I SAM-dependent methyltransferase [Planctomycetota bacterium]